MSMVEISQIVLNGVTAAAASASFECRLGLLDTVHYIDFDADATAGEVVIETAYDKDYAGTWHVLDTVSFIAASRSHAVHVVGSYRAIRHRVTAAITSGTVTSRVYGSS